MENIAQFLHMFQSKFEILFKYNLKHHYIPPILCFVWQNNIQKPSGDAMCRLSSIEHKKTTNCSTQTSIAKV